MFFGTCRYGFHSFLSELQVLFQIIRHCSHEHPLVGITDSTGVDFSQPHELCQGSEDGFYGGAALDFKSSTPLAVYSGYGPLELFVVSGDGDAFFGRIPNTGRLNRTALALAWQGKVFCGCHFSRRRSF